MKETPPKQLVSASSFNSHLISLNLSVSSVKCTFTERLQRRSCHIKFLLIPENFQSPRLLAIASIWVVTQ